jgi:tRNA dimethylallyltransferase
VAGNDPEGLPPVIFLMGPTASGKTKTVTRIFEEFKCELVSVDAAQVYRGMDIGTAKPDHEFLEAYPHHLIDIIEIEDRYSVAEFCSDAVRLSREILQRGNTPVFVGGTMFYFSALENGLAELPRADSSIQDQIESEARNKGLSALYQELVDADSVLADRISPHDSQRVQRAIVLLRQTGIRPSELIASGNRSGKDSDRKGAIGNPIVKLALFSGDRKTLHQRIERRFMEMLDHGLVEETRGLVQGIDNPEILTSMRTVGYRQVLNYLINGTEYQQMVDNGVAATRQLAKRQLTWMRNQSNLVWFDNLHAGATAAILRYLRAHGHFH